MDLPLQKGQDIFHLEAEEAAMLEVKQYFGFSLLSAEGNPQFLFQHVNAELPQGPGVFVGSHLDLTLRQCLVTEAQKLAWICATACAPGNSKVCEDVFYSLTAVHVERRQGFRGLGFVERSQCFLFLIVCVGPLLALQLAPTACLL